MDVKHAVDLRNRLVALALEWQTVFGVAPAITSVLSEFDAATLVGCPLEVYCKDGAAKTAVSRGHDFISNGLRYQVKANRPSGKPGSPVRIVPKPANYEWDRLIWILYDRQYTVVEAWEWDVTEYRRRFEALVRVRPQHMRDGRRLT